MDALKALATVALVNLAIVVGLAADAMWIWLPALAWFLGVGSVWACLGASVTLFVVTQLAFSEG